MSAILELEQLHSSACPQDCICVKQGVTPASLHGLDWYRRDQTWKLITIVEAQREEAELADIGRPLAWCLDCDQCGDDFIGSLDSFGSYLFETGWTVVSVERATLQCPKCADHQIELSEEQEREDFMVYEARGK